MIQSIFRNNLFPIKAVRAWKAANSELEFVLTANDCREIIKSFLSNELSASAVTEWADFMEFREWVEYEQQNASIIADFLFEISTPEINGKVSDNITLATYKKFDDLARK